MLPLWLYILNKFVEMYAYTFLSEFSFIFYPKKGERDFLPEIGVIAYIYLETKRL